MKIINKKTKVAKDVEPSLANLMIGTGEWEEATTKKEKKSIFTERETRDKDVSK